MKYQIKRRLRLTCPVCKNELRFSITAKKLNSFSTDCCVPLIVSRKHGNKGGFRVETANKFCNRAASKALGKQVSSEWSSITV